VPNERGGNENLEAIGFLRGLCETLYREHPDVQVIAEESTAWPMVTRPTYLGGLGFGLKWDMGFMHDTLAYFREDPVHRRYHHGRLTFRAVYARHENFVLPLSHDEVVHGKGSLLDKMAGDSWQKFANLRLLYAYMWAQPGKKLLFMGGEFGQGREWNHEASLDWHLTEGATPHTQLQRLVGELNRLYRDHSALHELDCGDGGFEWVDADDSMNSVFSFIRKDRAGRSVLAVFNCTPVPRQNYQLGVSEPGEWMELINTDAREFGGSGWGNLGRVVASPTPRHGRPLSLSLTLPPLAGLFLIPVKPS
jgi:1,4-alpha-glucan branching enzyme